MTPYERTILPPMIYLLFDVVVVGRVCIFVVVEREIKLFLIHWSSDNTQINLG